MFTFKGCRSIPAIKANTTCIVVAMPDITHPKEQYFNHSESVFERKFWLWCHDILYEYWTRKCWAFEWNDSKTLIQQEQNFVHQINFQLNFCWIPRKKTIKETDYAVHFHLKFFSGSHLLQEPQSCKQKQNHISPMHA